MAESTESTYLSPGMNSRLYEAAEWGNVDLLNRLIQAKINIFQEFTPLQNSALHIAVSRGNLRFTERLLQAVMEDLDAGREFVRAKNSDGNSALHLAAFYGHHQLVEKFLKLMEGDVEVRDDFLSCVNCEGNSALHEAAKGGNYKVVDVLLNHCPPDDLTSVTNDAGETALLIASQSGHTKIVERLLPFMASNSKTTLHSAVLYGHTGVVKKLLQHSPDLAKQRDECGRTAMHMPVLSPPVPGFMGVDWTGLYDFNRITRLLLEKDNSLCYIQDDKKQTPLHMAVEWERYYLIRILLRHGRDCMELVDGEGRKPLHVAVINAIRSTRTNDIVRLYKFKNMLFSIISRKSLNHCDNRGRTALHIAIENLEKDPALYENIIRALQIHGALLTEEILEDTTRIELLTPKSRIKAEHISINAVLIATVSFAAAFTLPGGLDSQHQDVFMNIFLFKVLMIRDTFSFGASIAPAILLQFSGTGEHEEQFQILFSFSLMWSTLISLVVAFGAAIHLVITPSPWLVEIVWTMVSLVPLTIFVVRFKSKQHIFTPVWYNIWPELPFTIIRGIFYIISDTLNVFLSNGDVRSIFIWLTEKYQRKK